MSMNDSRLYMVNDIFNRMSKEFVTVDGNVRKIQRETLTPYKVATVILIKEYCNDNTKGTLYPFIMQYDILLSFVKVNSGNYFTCQEKRDTLLIYLCYYILICLW